MSRAAAATSPVDPVCRLTGCPDVQPLIDYLLDALADRVAERLGWTDKPSTDRWLSTKEAAEHLAIHPDTLRKYAAARSIPFEQDGPGCALHFRLSDLDAWRASGGERSAAASRASTRLPRGLRAL